MTTRGEISQYQDSEHAVELETSLTQSVIHSVKLRIILLVVE
jgi:hypothetical protein